MPNSPKIDYALQILNKIHNQQHRISVALKKRDKVIEGMKGNGVPSDLTYRQDFVVEAATLLKEFMNDMILEFNQNFKEDIVLNHDVADILDIVGAQFGIKKKEPK